MAYSRTETFVLEFKDKAAFRKLFATISSATFEKDGFFMKVAAVGNQMEDKDILEEFIQTIQDGDRVSPELEERVLEICNISP